MEVNDLTNLARVTEESILATLESRFHGGKIYTSLGDAVLVKVNPFEYKDSHETGGPNVKHLAKRAREQAVATGQNQSCMMTGESGAGKTEATKLFLKELAGQEFCTNEMLHIQLVESCTLLESFGNAATEHNHNSSRFARWFELKLDRKRGKVFSGTVHQYLLEKARVVKGATTSSNFHVLYDVCTSVGEGEQVNESALEQHQDHFKYLQGRIGKGSAERWLRMQCQLENLGASEETIEGVEHALWCVLHLGNLEFVDDGNEGCSLDPASKHALKCVADMLGIDDVELVCNLFTTKRLETGRDVVVAKRNAQQARDARDALAKDLYSRLFKWVVDTINHSIDTTGMLADGASSSLSLATVGILDVFGFECFEENSFEQLCINYCNEKLVQQFHGTLVQAEIRVCREEGVPAERIGIETQYEQEQQRKQFVLSGIDEVFSIIQDEIRLPRATDKTLTQKLLKLDLGTTVKAARMAGAEVFTINHYAGTVCYQVSGFLTKNKDEGPVEITHVLFDKSSNEFVKLLFDDSKMGDAAEPQDSPARRRQAKKKKAIGMQFRDEFSTLAATLSESQQQFVMCVKPNREAKPAVFDRTLVLRQLEYNGLLTVCSVRKSAFAAHLPFSQFIAIYSLLYSGDATCSNNVKQERALVEAMVEEFLDAMYFDDDSVFIGKTRVLLRAEAVIFLDIQLKTFSEAAVKIQSLFRMVPGRREFLSMRCCSIRIQAFARMVLAKKDLVARHKRVAAAVVLQAFARRILAQQLHRRLLVADQQERAATRVQSFARMVVAMRVKTNLRAERRKKEDLEKLKARQLGAAVLLQSIARRRFAYRRAKQLRRKAAAEQALRATTMQPPKPKAPLFPMQGKENESRRENMPEDERARVVVTSASIASNHEALEEMNSKLVNRPTIPKGKRRRPGKKQAGVIAGVAAVTGAAAATAVASVTKASGAVATPELVEPLPPLPRKPNGVTKKVTIKTDDVVSAPQTESGQDSLPTSPVSIGMDREEELEITAIGNEDFEPSMEDPEDETCFMEQPQDSESHHSTDMKTQRLDVYPTETPEEEEEEEKETERNEDAPVATTVARMRVKSTQVSGGDLRLMSAVTIQRVYRGWLARRMTHLRKQVSKELAHLKRIQVERKEELAALKEFTFAQDSKTFYETFGMTEEVHYEDVARNVPAFNFLVVEKKFPAPGLPKKSFEQQNAIARKQLQVALEKRDFKSLSEAVRVAYDAQYSGMELYQAEVLLGQIRKVHIKQMEAEAALAERFGYVVL